MDKISVEYLRRLGVCWSPARLRAAAKEWPANPTWAWFLGARLADMNRPQVLDRVHVALGHVALQKISLPTAPGQIAEIAKTSGDAELLSLCEALGEALDLADQPGEAYAAALEGLQDAILSAKHSGVIEATP